jgi:hypothetical protein
VTAGPYTYKIAASNSTATDKAKADYVCTGTNDQTTINNLMPFTISPPTATESVNIFFFNGDYSIDAPITINSGCVLQGATERGVMLNCNNGTAVFQSSVPAMVHQLVRIDSFQINAGTAGTNDVLACDFRGFVRSQFSHLFIFNFTTGVWFGGDLPTYDSCWTNVLSQFYLSECLVGVKMQGTTPGGGPTANNITLTEGEIICRDASGGKAIDAIDGAPTVEKTDIGYGNASAGIVLGANTNNTRIVDSRFEWDAQGAGLYPISIGVNSFYHYFAGNIFTGGCTQPNIYDANTDPTTGVGGRYLQINDCQADTNPIVPGGPVFGNGFIDINIDTYFRRSPTFPAGVFVQGDMNSAFAAVTAANASVFSVNTNGGQVNVLNGGGINLFSDEYATSTMNLDGSNGRVTLTGDIISTGLAPSATPATAAGVGASASIVGHNMAGYLTLTTGTGPSIGKVVGITWGSTKPNSGYALTLTAANAAAVTAMGRIFVDLYVQTDSAASIDAVTALAASTTYVFLYSAISF